MSPLACNQRVFTIAQRIGGAQRYTESPVFFRWSLSTDLGDDPDGGDRGAKRRANTDEGARTNKIYKGLGYVFSYQLTMNSIDDFVSRISKKKNTSMVSNPYRNPDLANNLKVYLNAISELPETPILLVGEALGFKGGKLTGIPFSSGQIFQRYDHAFLEQIRDKLIIEKIESENTATIVWEYLTTRNITPLCWNAFPFHPHPKSAKNKNRAPNAKEMASGSRYLKTLQSIFQNDIIVGVGNKGAQCARKAFPDKEIQTIRHPSYGGKADFIQGLNTILSP